MQTARVLRAFITSGLLFMLIPGTFLGVVNLLQASASESVGVVSSAWLQAHGHAQIFGWVGSFILGIGFYSLSMQPAGAPPRIRAAWWCWGLWSLGVLLRWTANVYEWHWQALLPVSAAMELTAFVIFVASVAGHRAPTAAGPETQRGRNLWMAAVMTGVLGFGSTLLVNVVMSLQLAQQGNSPALPHLTNQYFLILIAWGFLAPFIWGFSTKWLPVFLGLAPKRDAAFVTALAANIVGLGLALTGHVVAAMWCFLAAAIVMAAGIRIFEPRIDEPKTRGVHASFPAFVRTAYVWLLIAAALGVAAARWDTSGGIWGASRHAFTVGFVSVMIFSIGQRVLPAFASAGVLWSPRLMAWSLTLLVIGCAIRVPAEILAYQHYAESAWALLPVSAIIEMLAFTLFAANLLVTVHRS
jgi:hypothetical protein